MLALELPSPAATRLLGRSLASTLRPPALVTLAGELGTGKTTLVRHVFRALGVTGPVVSPSFALAQSYQGRGAQLLHHLDLYRLLPGDDVDLFAWDDYLTERSITFIEWPEAASQTLPPPDLAITLSHRSTRARAARLEGSSALEQALADALRAVGLVLVSYEDEEARAQP